jgi:hypothetical protein
MGRIDDRLHDLGITLPDVPQPVANYVPAKRFANLAQTAGQVARLGDHEYKGQLGATLGPEPHHLTQRGVVGLAALQRAPNVTPPQLTPH